MPCTLRLKLLLITLICFTALSCAVAPHSNSYRKSKTPTGMINAYKAESQKRDFDKLISQNRYSKPSFLKEKNNSTVKMWVKYFTTRGKGSYERYLINGEKYRPLIERTFAEQGLPKELYFVGLIESGYYLKAKSRASAVGPWQFIKATATRYGLKVRRGVDERKNIVKATKAAGRYFKDLYNIFGSWELALSAYNAGEYGVIRRIRKAGTRDFYELSRRKILPRETRNYIPKILAAMEVYKNAKKHNISIPYYSTDNFKGIKTVRVSRSTYIKDLSKQYGVSQSELKRLNNDLSRNATPSTKYELIIPSSSRKTSFQPRRIASVKRKTRTKSRTNRSTKTYRVKKGDNLTWIAKRNKTTIRKIMKLNRLKRKTVYIGQKLKLPTRNFKTYTVRSGDFLLKIAKKHSITIAKLKKFNSMKSSKIFPGQKLIVSVN